MTTKTRPRIDPQTRPYVDPQRAPMYDPDTLCPLQITRIAP